MAYKYIFSIDIIDIIKEIEFCTNVAHSVSWTMYAAEGEESFSIYGKTMLNLPDNSNFVKYENLTKDLVKNWVFDILGETKISEIKEMLSKGLKDKIDKDWFSTGPGWNSVIE